MGFVTIEESDDEKSIVTPNCRVLFRKAGERWTHAIESGAGSARVMIARSIEADAERDNYRALPSPAFQDLHIQVANSLFEGPRELDLNPSYVFMLVGQFGPIHFSAAITVGYRPGWQEGDPTPGPQSTCIEFDIAQRCRERIENLASTYQVWSEFEQDGLKIWSAENGPELITARLNKGDSPSAETTIDSSDPSRCRVKFVRGLLPFQSNGRLVYRWSVNSRQ